MAVGVIDDAVTKLDYRNIEPMYNRPPKASSNVTHDHLAPDHAERTVWIGLIVASGTCLSPFFACVTPFAALAALAALKLGPRDGFVVIGFVWLANQAIGYGFLGYPWTWDSVAWGLAIGACSGLAVVAAKALSTARPAPLAISLPFMAAFTAFEFGLYVAGYVLPGSNGAFSAAVVGQIFLTNAVVLCALIALFVLAMIPWMLTPNAGSNRLVALSEDVDADPRRRGSAPSGPAPSY